MLIPFTALGLALGSAACLGVGVLAGAPPFSIVALVLAAATGLLLYLPGRQATASTVPAAAATPAARTTAARTTAARKPAAGKPAAGKPAVRKPAAGKPAVAKTAAATPTADAPAAAPAPEPESASELIRVVAGRRRYHRPGCDLLEGLESEEIALVEARAEGFTACTRCCTREPASVG